MKLPISPKKILLSKPWQTAEPASPKIDLFDIESGVLTNYWSTMPHSLCSFPSSLYLVWFLCRVIYCYCSLNWWRYVSLFLMVCLQGSSADEATIGIKYLNKKAGIRLSNQMCLQLNSSQHLCLMSSTLSQKFFPNNRKRKEYRLVQLVAERIKEDLVKYRTAFSNVAG